MSESSATDAMAFYNRHWPSYYPARDALLSDPALKNRSYSEIEGDLWALLNDLIREREQFGDKRALRDRIEEFAEQLTRPTDEYEIAISIEHVTLPDGEITIGRTVFVHFDEERARSWGIDLDDPVGLAKDIVGRTAGLVRVHAGSFDKAWELAAQEVDTSLAIMRSAMAASRAMTPLDELLLQRRGAVYAGRRVTGEPLIQGGGRRGFKEIDLDIRGTLSDRAEPLTKAARDMGARVGALYDGSLPLPLANALIRALEWIGSSITRESYDDKVVDLCTAMETMLSVKSDGRKGEAIALRYLVLTSHSSANYLYPHAVLPIYEVRSQVIHGAERRVASGQDYALMREVATETFSMVLELAKRNPDIRSVTHLIQFLENDADRIERVVSMVVSQDFKYDRQVAKHAGLVAQQIRNRQTPSEAPIGPHTQ